jgi:hypothetical protein
MSNAMTPLVYDLGNLVLGLVMYRHDRRMARGSWLFFEGTNSRDIRI